MKVAGIDRLLTGMHVVTKYLKHWTLLNDWYSWIVLITEHDSKLVLNNYHYRKINIFDKAYWNEQNLPLMKAINVKML